MAGINDLIEQHILQYESRLKHIDELLGRAEKAKDRQQESELKEIKQDREELSGEMEKLKKQPPEYWNKLGLEKAGPMGAWDAVAQRLEKLVERIDRKKP